MIRAAFAFAVMLSSIPAHADPTTALKLADEAKDLGEKGLFRDAAKKFAEAYREDPSSNNVFCNIGVSYYKAEDWARAHLLLKLCLDRTALEKDFIDKANAVIATIEEQLRAGNHAQVAIRVIPSTTSITVVDWDKEATFTSDRVLWLPLGTHKLAARSEGYVDQTIEVRVESPAKQDVTITMKKPGGDIIQPPPPPITKSSRPSIVLPLIGSGVTLGAGILAIIASGKASETEDIAPFALDRDAFDNDKREIKKWNTITGASATLAIVGAGATAYLWYRFVTYKGPALEVAPTAGGATATIRGRF